jgi:hypothetical protein
MQLRVRLVELIENVYVVKDARRRGVTDHCLDAFGFGPIDDCSNGKLRCGRIHDVNGVAFTNRDAGGVAKPFRII